ncbi:MAG: hypothetical protein Q8K45_15395 [Rubrivivax sp.]|nr:hypothetical protein [Rubrivivax sp.]
MQRRAALTALAWGCGGPALAAQAPATPPLAGQLLAWGSEGCWVASPDGGLQHLPDRLATGTRPALTSRGLWLVNAQGALRGWAQRGDHAWQLQHTVAWAAPVHALAASPDGRWLAAAHGAQLSLLDDQGTVLKAFDGSSLDRELRGAATALFTLPQRRSFVAAWPSLGEVWEVSLDPEAAPIFDGLVHDYRMGEAIAKPGYLGARRATLGRPLPAFVFADARVPWLAGTLGAEVVVMHLDVRRRIATLQAGAAKPAGAALRRAAHGHGALEWWLPAGQEVHVYDTTRWVRTAVHTLPGAVQQLQVMDDAGAAAVDTPVWARIDSPGGPTLWRWDNTASGWQPAGRVLGTIVALGGTPPGRQLLVLRSEAPALLRLDRSGGLLAHWPLPANIAWQGLAAWPLV